MSKTLFDKIIDREIPANIVWEDDAYIAFLTPFANTDGVTVVVPKQNLGDNLFHLEDQAIAGLMVAAKKVARALEKAFVVERVAMVVEGEAVPHVHVKLYPMHGMHDDRSHFPKQEIFFPAYPGYISSVEGPKMADDKLLAIQQKITEAINHEN